MRRDGKGLNGKKRLRKDKRGNSEEGTDGSGQKEED